MRLNMPIIRFTAIAILVMVLGALAGWYLFVNRQVRTNNEQDQARGFGTSVSFGSSIGSALNNLFGGSNEGAGVTDPNDAGASFGGSIGNLIGGIVDGVLGTQQTPQSKQAPRLWRVNATPVAGFAFASSSAKIYFADRSSGNILSADPQTAQIERLTNTLFAQVHEAVFARDGSVVLRSIGDGGQIVSYAAVMATNTAATAGDTVKRLEGTYLPENIISIDARSAPNELLFILREGDGSAIIASSWLGGSQRRLISSALSDWSVMQLQDGTRYLSQKPSDDVMGHAFKIVGTSTLEKVAGLPGLSILPRENSQAILYSTVSGGSIALYARTAAGGNEVRLPIRTTADKCVWSPDTRLIAYCAVPQTSPARGYLRSLFDGSTHTSDAWWRVDVTANSAEQLFAPDTTMAFDVESPATDAAGTHIGFIDAEDKSLWLLRILP